MEAGRGGVEADVGGYCLFFASASSARRRSPGGLAALVEQPRSEDLKASHGSGLASCFPRCYCRTMQFDRVPHPTTALAGRAFKVWATVATSPRSEQLSLPPTLVGIGAPAGGSSYPSVGTVARRRVGRTTCFEAFLRAAGDDAYREWNSRLRAIGRPMISRPIAKTCRGRRSDRALHPDGGQFHLVDRRRDHRREAARCGSGPPAVLEEADGTSPLGA